MYTRRERSSSKNRFGSHPCACRGGMNVGKQAPAEQHSREGAFLKVASGTEDYWSPAVAQEFWWHSHCSGTCVCASGTAGPSAWVTLVQAGFFCLVAALDNSEIKICTSPQFLLVVLKCVLILWFLVLFTKNFNTLQKFLNHDKWNNALEELNVCWDLSVHKKNKVKGYFYIATTEDQNNNWGKHEEKLVSLKAQSFLACWQSKIGLYSQID